MKSKNVTLIKIKMPKDHDTGKVLPKAEKEIDDAFKVYKDVSKKMMPLSRPLFLANMSMLLDEYAARNNEETVGLAVEIAYAVNGCPEFVIDDEDDEDEEDEEDDE